METVECLDFNQAIATMAQLMQQGIDSDLELMSCQDGGKCILKINTGKKAKEGKG